MSGSAQVSADLLRNLTLAVPLLAVGVAASARSRRGDLAAQIPAAVLATLYAWVGVLAIEWHTPWWSFAPARTTVLGMPLETSLGWALVWGALPVLVGAGPSIPESAAWLLGFLWMDVLLMPRLDPLLTLGPQWWLGEALLLGCVAAPALLFGQLTRSGLALGARVVLQMLTFGGLFLWLAPTLALARDNLSWSDVSDHGFAVRGLLVMLAVLVSVPMLAAVAELARVGGGTPFPWDPPSQLVTTGPYAYLRNPMQVGMTALLLLLATAAGSRTLLLGVAVSLAFVQGIAEPHEQLSLSRRWSDYRDYRREVRAWLPRWRPLVTTAATLWVSDTCELCHSTGVALDRLGPVGLSRRPAEECPAPIERMRWESGEHRDQGVAAFARALEHTSAPWAWFGWLLRLPIAGWMFQTIADACGLGPRALPRTHTVGS